MISVYILMKHFDSLSFFAFENVAREGRIGSVV